jgi:hypothetical protein
MGALTMRFMIIGLPRSMTTWAANWLSGDGLTVAHDPLYRAHYSEWAGRFDAVSCTGIWRWPDWVNAQPCRKLILRRPEGEVAAAIAKLGLQIIPGVDGGDKALDRIAGAHIYWTDLLDARHAGPLWAWLRPGVPFDAERHSELTRWKIEPRLSRIAEADAGLQARLFEELKLKAA